MAVNYVQVAVAVVELHIIRDSWAFGSIGLGLANGASARSGLLSGTSRLRVFPGR